MSIDYWAIAEQDDPIDYGPKARWDRSAEATPLPESVRAALAACRKENQP